jgi:hypothetical protein
VVDSEEEDSSELIMGDDGSGKESFLNLKAAELEFLHFSFQKTMGNTSKKL